MTIDVSSVLGGLGGGLVGGGAIGFGVGLVLKKVIKILFYIAAIIGGGFVGGLLLLEHYGVITINPNAFTQIQGLAAAWLQTQLTHILTWATTVAQTSSSLLGGLGVGFVGGFLLGLKA